MQQGTAQHNNAYAHHYITLQSTAQHSTAEQSRAEHNNAYTHHCITLHTTALRKVAEHSTAQHGTAQSENGRKTRQESGGGQHDWVLVGGCYAPVLHACMNGTAPHSTLT